MRVWIDTREQKRGVRAKKYYKQHNFKVEVKHLDVADYVFDGKVAFEYKTVADFMHSLTDENNSLFEEVANQGYEYRNKGKYSYIVIVGKLVPTLKRLSKYSRSKNYVQNSIAQYNGAIRTLRKITNGIIICDTEEEALEEMYLQARSCLKTSKYGGTGRRLKIDRLTAVDVLLTSVKNIGLKTSNNIIKELKIKNVQDLLDCTVTDFESVNRVNLKKAREIYKFLHKGEKR